MALVPIMQVDPAAVQFAHALYQPTHAGLAEATVGTFATGTLRAMPIYVPNPSKISHFGISCTAAISFKFGLYTSADGYPNVLKASATLAHTGGGAVEDIALTTPILLRPAIYWVAFSPNGSATGVGRVGAQNFGRFSIGFTAAATGTEPSHITVAHTYADPIPNPFGSPTLVTGQPPRCWVKIV